MFITTYLNESFKLYNFYNKVNETNKIIRDKVKSGNEYIEIKYKLEKCVSNYLMCYAYLNKSDDLWNNSWIAYYNKAKIIVIN